MPAFDGFPRELPEFLAELASNNAKPWFDTNRKRYQALYVQPALAFVAAVEPGLARLSPELRAEARVYGSVMRINRDVRFAADKTPYKTTLDMMFPQGPTMDRKRPALLFRLAADELILGTGMHGFAPAQLAAWRAGLVDPAAGKALRQAIAAAGRAGFADVGGQHYKQVPRGFDAAHPNADLLRHAGLYVTRAEPLPDALFGPKAVEHCLKAWRAVRPIQQWLAARIPTG